MQAHLKTISSDTHKQIAFFGGNFCGLPRYQKEKYFAVSDRFISQGQIHSVRISTRPDTINDDELKFLKSHHVSHIELGAQSMNDDVLKQSGRGHTAAQTRQAAHEILQHGFVLGLQMMIGLPGDTMQMAEDTALEICHLGAVETRIYPCLVIADTDLAKDYERGLYKPLSMEDAVNGTAELFLIFEKHNVKILKAGLHPSSDLQSGSSLIAGPYHPSFRELVETKIWGDILSNAIIDRPHLSRCAEIFVPPSCVNFAAGYSGMNRKYLQSFISEIKFKTDAKLTGRQYKINYSR